VNMRLLVSAQYAGQQQNTCRDPPSFADLHQRRLT
jgi:hypothetical protein